MLLNPLSKFYEQIIQSPELWLYVEEKGDEESGFRAERLLIEPEIKSDGGVVCIKMNHLTAVGLGLGAMPSAVEEVEKDVECVNCGQGGVVFWIRLWGGRKSKLYRGDGIGFRLTQTFFLVRVGANLVFALEQLFANDFSSRANTRFAPTLAFGN